MTKRPTEMKSASTTMKKRRITLKPSKSKRKKRRLSAKRWKKRDSSRSRQQLSAVPNWPRLSVCAWRQRPLRRKPAVRQRKRKRN